MQVWFETGAIGIAVAGVIALELLIVAAIALRRGGRPGALGLSATIAAGGLLTLAFVARDAGFDWRVSATLLGLAGIAHAIDLGLRWREPRGP